MKRGMNKSGQVWVETVVYTLIGLSIIGIVVGIATPKIKEVTDKALIEQTLSALNELNEKIVGTQTAIGSSRIVSFQIKKGDILIDSLNNQIIFTLRDTRLLYSEVGTPIRQGYLIILTSGGENDYDISLTLDYSDESNRPLNITYDNKDETYLLTKAPTPYQLLMENKGNSQLDILLV